MPDHDLFDIHCHIVPFVDDGARTRDEALNMLSMEYQQGVKNIIVTPHCRQQMFETPMEEIKKQFWVLRNLSRQIGSDLKLYLGCEFHANMEMVEMLKTGKAITMAGSRYVLTEFSTEATASYIRDRFYSLLSHGYWPIAAHLERYKNICKDMDIVEELISMGGYVQLNADSVIGKSGFASKRICKKLLKNGLVHFIGSDCHRTDGRISRIGDSYEYVTKKFGKAYADEIFTKNPSMILEKIKI